MGVDLPDDPDMPPDRRADHRDDEGGGGRVSRPGGAQAETRPRQEYYAELQVAVAVQKSVSAHQAVAR
ncbi:MAG: hypothetical protein M3Z75_30675, partial [Actinomycetota bacterium]|nr:hypothetical protein [Actinomycetota bacterium]